MIELYAITDDPAPPDPPLRAVQSSGLTALYAPAERREVTPEALWRHEELVEALMADRNLLPVRFGTLVQDPQAAAQALAERSAELAASLDRVRGAVELAVRAEARDSDPGTTRREGGGGGDYLGAKARRIAKADLVHERLAGAARESVIQSGPELLRAAYLVDRDAVERFVERVGKVHDTHPELDVLCTGPWPPYSFAGGTT